MKRLLSMFLVLVMVFSMLPVPAFASETEGPASETVAVTEETFPEEKASTETPTPVEEAPSTETPTPVEEAPSTETPAPVEEEPSTEAPAPVEEAPSTEAPASVEEAPSTETPTPVEEEPSTETPTPVEEEPSTEAPAPVEEAPSTEAPAPVEEEAPTEASAERICQEGCILEGEQEHLENNGECFVWIACDKTEGCEGNRGHEGECYGAALYADSTVTVSGTGYRGKYVVISDGSTSGLYYINGSGVIQNTNGTEAAFEPGTYTVYYGIGGSGSGRGNESTFASGTFTVGENAASIQVSLRSAQVNTGTAYATRVMYATSLFYNTASFDHVDVRVAGSYVIQMNGVSYSATVSNPTVVVKVGGTRVAGNSWTGSTSYEWRQTGLSLTKASVISVELTLDLTYTDADGQSHTLRDVQIVYDSVNDVSKFIDAIAICDMVQGLDFRVSVEEIQEVIEYYTVRYAWKVFNTDGTYTALPAGAPNPPAASGGHVAGSGYIYDTEYVTGTSFYDYDNGLLYTFHGWDTYSHSSAYNPIPSTGYYALDDGDTDPANNPTVTITADTYIYGYWTVSELEPSAAHIAIEKIFIVDGAEVSMEAAEDLWFRVDTGIDRDGDGETLIDVDYPMILAANGEYKIPVYQYDTPFVFTEHNADVPGYTRTTTVQVSGSHIVGSSRNGDSVTVTMDPVYQGENVHLGTVTYTNSYTKNVGTPIGVYPTLTLLKSAADSRLAQEGVVFTLYSDEACTSSVASVTTGSGGLATLDFGTVENAAPGTYYLKETQPLEGYRADPCVYAISLTVKETLEELRDGEYVQVTYYDIAVAVPEGSTAAHESGSDRLHIFNDPVLGSFRLNKTVIDMDEADKGKLSAVAIVHGPITRDAAGNITDIGATWQLELNSENGWAASVENLPLGEYLIHESFASVHGYTWTGVSYGQLETAVYNNITSGIFRVENETPLELTLINTYEEWTSADFYIKKIDEKGKALAGAVFTLSEDWAGAAVIDSKTTGADGYAHFSGFTVPEGQDSVTYYLRETKAPDGYYLSDQVYKVEITAVTNSFTGKTAYEPGITLVAGRSNGFDIDTDLLTVTNFPVLGELTVTKTFAGGVIPEGMTGVSVQIGGPNGYSKIVELNSENNWAVTVDDLMLGTYTVSELDANSPGYTWEVSYSATTVTLTEAIPGKTVPGTEISGNVTVTNSYTRNEEIYEIPTSLTVKKVGENGEALTGAVFTLERLSADGGSAVSSVSFTTGVDGIVVFDLLTGFVQNGEAIDGTYLLSETKAPEGYEPTATTWTVSIREEDGEIRWELNENKNVFEGFWDWIVGNVSVGTFENGILQVQNVRSKGSLTVQKTVVDAEGLYAEAEYSFTLDCSDDAFDKTFTLKAGESITVENIPWGTTYTLTEDTTGAAYTSAITDGGNGRIWAYETQIDVTNTYAYTTHNHPLALVKVDADDNTKVIPGAGFTLYADANLETRLGGEVFSDENGNLALNIETAGTYYLAETTTPEGYRPNSAVYVVTAEETAVVLNAGTADAVTQFQMHIRVAGLAGTSTNQIDYTYRIENTPIRSVTVNVKKIWVASEGVIHPESVEAVLYRDGKVFDTVVLNVENEWSYSWEGLTDEYTWNVDESAVPEGYTKNVTGEGYDFTITNTKQFAYIDVSVNKIWRGTNVEHPTSVRATLYRDGIAYDTVTLSAANNWRYTWKNLTDEFDWTVDEPSVPSGYRKRVRSTGYDFTIVNFHEDNPITGDFTNLLGMGIMATVGMTGFGFSVTALLAPRKKEEEEE